MHPRRFGRRIGEVVKGRFRTFAFAGSAAIKHVQNSIISFMDKPHAESFAAISSRRIRFLFGLLQQLLRLGLPTFRIGIL